jgi:hypothetical protein
VPGFSKGYRKDARFELMMLEISFSEFVSYKNSEVKEKVSGKSHLCFPERGLGLKRWNNFIACPETSWMSLEIN